MSGLPTASRYETSAPQWVDFDAITPSACPDDGYFDHFHDDLESTPYLRQMQPVTPDDNTEKSERLRSVKASSLFSDIDDSSGDSNFINDINQMYISPIKLNSPRCKNQDPGVLQELSVEDVLNDALKGMEIASSITKKRQTPKLNATACDTTSTTPNKRKIRVSKSINFNGNNKQTPVAGYRQSARLKNTTDNSEKITTDGMSEDQMNHYVNEDQDEDVNKGVTAGTNKGGNRCVVAVNEEYKENMVNVKVPKIKIDQFKTPTKNVLSHHRTPSGRTAIKIITTPCRMNLQNSATPSKNTEAYDVGINEREFDADNTMIAEEELEDEIDENIKYQETKSPGKQVDHTKVQSDANMTICSDNNYRSKEKRKIRLSKSLHHPSPSAFRKPNKIVMTPCTVKLERLTTPLQKIKINNIHLFDKSVKDTMDIDDDLQAEIESANKVSVKQELITPAAAHTETRITDEQPGCSKNIQDYDDNDGENLDVDQVSPNKSSTSIEAPANISIEEQDDDVFEPLEDFRKKLDGEEDQKYFKVHHNRHPMKRQSCQVKPKVLTGTARRRSDQYQPFNKPNTKYVSLAEGVSTFHRSTPTRFHTVSTKKADTKAGPVQKIKQQTSKRTIPVSPAWHGRTRTRQPLQTQSEREELARQKTKIRANPIPKGILTAPKALKAVPKKPPTEPKPFQLTGTRKVATKKPTSTSTATTSTVTSATSSAASTSTANVSASRVASQTRKTVLTLNEDGVAQQQQVLHFGIPVVTKKNINVTGTKRTIPQPFSLEARNQEFLRKKERKLEKLREEEAKKLKTGFHARPVPNLVKKPISQEINKEKVKKAPATSKVMPFSFENRDKMLAKKKEELRKKAEEEAKKVRVFHANPAPTFKPVTVRTTSKESIRSETRENAELKVRAPVRTVSADRLIRGNSNDKLQCQIGARGLSAQNLRSRQDSFTAINFIKKPLGSSNSSIKDSQLDQENDSSNAPSTSSMPAMKQNLTTLPVALHSDRRAKKRREYDDKLKRQTEQEEAFQRMEQQAILAKEQADVAKLRRNGEIKARPMPVYKPLVVVKSSKPLTEPSSPAWSRPKH
ncbi:targeting protein for Xklp2-like [Microplitis mediator]|uniref:targeting protein for Xklp2-like n=1 Tax=Microplitis mediator TaxID=375433 RepID=UPI0025532A8D|nr:targeting protein for Xklp2-like [Microplitis mediator]